MDGEALVYQLEKVLQEGSTSTFMDDRTSYDYLYKAAVKTVEATKCLTSAQTITTVADQTSYDLEADFLSLYITDTFNQHVVKLNDGSSDYWITMRPYEAVYYSNNSTSVGIPWNFSIRDKQTLTARITGSATSDGASSNGECTLTDSAAPFTYAKAGDQVHNTTDSSHGVVLSVTSTSALVTALFGGTNNYWTSSDGYAVVPAGRRQIILDPPPSSAGYSLYVPYIQKPAPVYSPYSTYRFDRDYDMAIVYYAAWLYKYRDREPSFGDAFYKYWRTEIGDVKNREDNAKNKHSFRVNMKKRSYGDRSYR